MYLFSRSSRSFVENSFTLISIRVEIGGFCRFISLSVVTSEDFDNKRNYETMVTVTVDGTKN